MGSLAKSAEGVSPLVAARSALERLKKTCSSFELNRIVERSLLLAVVNAIDNLLSL
jgi:hypothetical protein